MCVSLGNDYISLSFFSLYYHQSYAHSSIHRDLLLRKQNTFCLFDSLFLAEHQNLSKSELGIILLKFEPAKRQELMLRQSSSVNPISFAFGTTWISNSWLALVAPLIVLRKLQRSCFIKMQVTYARYKTGCYNEFSVFWGKVRCNKPGGKVGKGMKRNTFFRVNWIFTWSWRRLPVLFW